MRQARVNQSFTAARARERKPNRHEPYLEALILQNDTKADFRATCSIGQVGLKADFRCIAASSQFSSNAIDTNGLYAVQ